MVQELIYTSAPQGLLPGTQGYCIVGCSRGMPKPLMGLMESMSSPVQSGVLLQAVYAHRHLRLSGELLHVLSCWIQVAADYSGRPAYLVHHFVLNGEEMRACDPVEALQVLPFAEHHESAGDPTWREPLDWQLVLRKLKVIEPEPSGSTPCPTWAKLKGDAGWAGQLVEATTKSIDVPQTIAYPSDSTETAVKLLREAILLMPQDERPGITFSIGVDAVETSEVFEAAEIRWRFVPEKHWSATPSMLDSGSTWVSRARSWQDPYWSSLTHREANPRFARPPQLDLPDETKEPFGTLPPAIPFKDGSDAPPPLPVRSLLQHKSRVAIGLLVLVVVVAIVLWGWVFFRQAGASGLS